VPRATTTPNSGAAVWNRLPELYGGLKGSSPDSDAGPMDEPDDDVEG